MRMHILMYVESKSIEIYNIALSPVTELALFVNCMHVCISTNDVLDLLCSECDYTGVTMGSIDVKTAQLLIQVISVQVESYCWPSC